MKSSVKNINQDIAALVSPKINYNQISSFYDKRFHVNDMGRVIAELQNLVKRNAFNKVLEVGCGTGYWIKQLHSFTGSITGLDLSLGMLQKINKIKSNILTINADANHIPIRSNTFDFIFCVNVIHLIENKKELITSTKRLLKKGGALSIITVDPRYPDYEWYLYKYFKGTYETDLERFPAWELIIDWMKIEKFDQIKLKKIKAESKNKIGREVLNDPFLQKDGCSQLSLLSNEAYKEGMELIEQDLKSTEDKKKQIIFPINITFGFISGYK